SCISAASNILCWPSTCSRVLSTLTMPPSRRRLLGSMTRPVRHSPRPWQRNCTPRRSSRQQKITTCVWCLTPVSYARRFWRYWRKGAECRADREGATRNPPPTQSRRRTDMPKQWLLARRPPGGLPADADFKLVEAPMPEPGPHQMLTRTIYLSLDPYQWGRKRSGAEAVGDVCHGRTVSQVVKSNLPEYAEGDFIFNTNGWQEYGLSGEGISVFEYMFPRKLDPTQAPISTAVGIMGMLGLTAYSGMILQCQPQAGETVVVSAASGGVGQIAGQIAQICGCRVVGIAGVQEKCDFVTEVLGFDACASHRSATLAEDLRAACPDGIDAYFENVGGKVF